MREVEGRFAPSALAIGPRDDDNHDVAPVPPGEPFAVILNESNATPFDLRFRLFGTDVRVHPLFWVISAVFGWKSSQHRGLSDSGFIELAIWVVCAFVSILLHATPEQGLT